MISKNGISVQVIKNIFYWYLTCDNLRISATVFFYFIIILFSLKGLNCLFANIEIGILQNIDNIVKLVHRIHSTRI